MSSEDRSASTDMMNRIARLEKQVAGIPSPAPVESAATTEQNRQVSLLNAAQAQGCPWPPSSDHLLAIITGKDWRSVQPPDPAAIAAQREASRERTRLATEKTLAAHARAVAQRDGTGRWVGDEFRFDSGEVHANPYATVPDAA